GLSLSEHRTSTPPALTACVKTWSAELGEAGTVARSRNPEEPWRQYVNLMRAALPTGETVASGRFKSATDLIKALRRLQDWLSEARCSRLAERDVGPVISKVRAFGFHLAAIDVRQNSAYHDKALSQLLVLAGVPDAEKYSEWNLQRRRAVLNAELETRRPLARPVDVQGPEARAVVDLYQSLCQHIALCGVEGLGALIVSMTRSAEDLLAVHVLAREGGLMRYDDEGGYVPLTVVPLFETIEDLQRAPEIMDAYLSYPIVKRSLARQSELRGADGLVQQIMVGYSDSCKDGGIVASTWGLNRSQKALVDVGKKHGVRVSYFHGRGGTIGRGAGPTHRFVRALPPNALHAQLRVTEQGETIRQKYANPMTAAHHIELLSASLLGSRALDESGRVDPPELVSLMDQLAATSRDAYVELLNADGFVAFFERCTPIDAIENSRIGSRPSRRPGARKLSNLRAIPWVFAWNQARFVLPGWYGLGSGLKALQASDPDGFERLRIAKREDSRWAPIHYLISNVATAWATASVSIMKQYAALADELPQTEMLFQRIVDEYELTQAGLELFYGAPLAQARPQIHRIVSRRAEALRPLHHYQISLLKTWRQTEGEKAAAIVPRILRTINAISSGLGVTG
ncbi:MAG: phosphoenolpyruvate carboxylase, partial [Myxococcota bacterium]